MGHDSSLADGEESVRVLHPHWKTLVGPVAAGLLVAVALAAAEVLIPGNKYAAIERLAVAVVAVALLVLLLLLPVLVLRTPGDRLSTMPVPLRGRHPNP